MRVCESLKYGKSCFGFLPPLMLLFGFPNFYYDPTINLLPFLQYEFPKMSKNGNNNISKTFISFVNLNSLVKLQGIDLAPPLTGQTDSRKVRRQPMFPCLPFPKGGISLIFLGLGFLSPNYQDHVPKVSNVRSRFP